MVTKRKKIFRLLKITVLVYCTIGIALYYLQEKFLFHPVKLNASHQFSFTQKFREINIPFNKEDTCNLVKFLPEGNITRGVVLYFHGNRENVERYAKFAEVFTKQGYEVWMEDYPGFGKSSGEITEKKLYDQALSIRKMAQHAFANDSIIVYGKSLGTAIAAYTASTFKPKALVLETPYYSIPDLFGSYAFIYPAGKMSKFNLPTYKFLEDTQSPVTIFHGTDDGVVFFGCAEKLKNKLKPTDQFITITGGTHHNLAAFKEYKTALDSILIK